MHHTDVKGPQHEELLKNQGIYFVKSPECSLDQAKLSFYRTNYYHQITGYNLWERSHHLALSHIDSKMLKKNFIEC